MSSSHSRSTSDESSMSIIFEHMGHYPGSYEIPLRTMFELNCVPRSELNFKDLIRAQTSNLGSGNSSPVTGQVAWTGAETTGMSFASQLMSHLQSLPKQPKRLPPSFLVNYVTRCFHPVLALVDWAQALTALDYLKDLETRRSEEAQAAFERVHIFRETYESDMETMAEQFPGIALWVRNIEGKHRKAESYYAQIWLGLRRWMMINELSQEPYNKLNCLGLLNTLFPPAHDSTKLPNFLDLQAFNAERSWFFDRIRLVGESGPSILEAATQVNKAPGDTTGYPSVQRILDKYSRVAKQMIDDCLATAGPESFAEHRAGKKTDSGVSLGGRSFGSDRRPSVASSLHEQHVLEPMPSYTPSVKALSKLERITREFKRMRVKPRPDIEEIVQVNQRSAVDYVPQPAESTGRKSLKKARSLASLKFGNSSSLSLSSRKGSESVPFDPEQMKKHRQLYEASVNKS